MQTGYAFPATVWAKPKIVLRRWLDLIANDGLIPSRKTTAYTENSIASS
jgi:hypothetical protein